MTIYLVLMGIVAIFALFSPNYFGLWPRISAFIILLIFCGARFEVGSDWFSYTIFYNYLMSNPINFSLSSEPSFTLLCKLSDFLGFGIIGVNLGAAAIYLLGLFWIAANTKSPWCAIAAALCYYIPALPMGIIRQGIGIGIIYILVASWPKLNDFYRVVIAIFAMTFHLSAVIMLGVILAASRLKIWQKGLFVILLFSILAILGLNPLELFSTYNDRYIDGIDGVVIETTAAQLHWFLIAGPSAVYLVFRKRLQADWLDNELMVISSFISILLIIILPFSSAAVTRLAMYFSFVPVIVSGMIVKISKERFINALIRGAVIGGTSSVLIFWLLFAQNAENYLPYRNILFEN